ncbi:MAG: hypothetical protein AAF490_32955 [Chloroflexota bacterium]
MKLVFWNIRSGGGYRVPEIAAQLKSWAPDLIALAEFRGTKASVDLTERLRSFGFIYQLDTINKEKLAMNALLLAAKVPLRQIDLSNAPTEPCRWLLATVEGKRPFTIGVMHVPNRVTKRKYPYFDAVMDVVNHWTLGPGLLVGDTNTGIPPLDGFSSPFTKEEIGWMNDLDAADWKDALRYLHGDKQVFTWYSHKKNGFRLDEAFFNQELLPRLKSIDHQWGKSATNPQRQDALSDHAAILLELD